MGYYEKYILRPIEKPITDEDAKVELICSKDHPVMGFFYESCFYRHPYVITDQTYALPYEELFCFANTTGENEDLGATVSINVNGQVFTSDKNFMIVVPAFVPHGPIEVTEMKTPIFSYCAGAGREHVGLPKENWVTEDVKPLEDMVIYYNGFKGDPHSYASEQQTVIMQCLYKYVPGTEFFSVLRRFEANGPWFFAGGHIHDNPELLAYYGMDPWHPYEMKHKITQYIGGEKYILDYPCVCYFPPYVFHCPLQIEETEKPCYWHSLAPGMSGYKSSQLKGLSGEDGDVEVVKPW
ncbi:MAG: hypothetical protein IKN57_05500 [Parasporobacterium sp.]|nr:hypothetical protein [Lachnospiraceae bacterium]MBR3642946.1 hypothetical protein [Parasporobacterium sp.]